MSSVEVQFRLAAIPPRYPAQSGCAKFDGMPIPALIDMCKNKFTIHICSINELQYS